MLDLRLATHRLHAIIEVPHNAWVLDTHDSFGGNGVDRGGRLARPTAGSGHTRGAYIQLHPALLQLNTINRVLEYVHVDVVAPCRSQMKPRCGKPHPLRRMPCSFETTSSPPIASCSLGCPASRH